MIDPGAIDWRGVPRRIALVALAMACVPLPARAMDAGTAPSTRVQIRAVDGLRFEQPRFAVAAGDSVRITFQNRDGSGMPHNLLITRPGAREEVVRQAMALGAEGAKLNYVPRTALVLYAMPLLGENESTTLEFEAPREPGIYPFVCTFPGHGFVMYGAMYVGVEMPPLAEDQNIPPTARQASGGAERPIEPTVRPRVLRYLMPDAGPAAIAVALPGGQNYVWDAGAARLRYAWDGDFVDRSRSLDGSNGKLMQLPARLLGEVYYRAGDRFPIRIGSRAGEPAVHYRGYRLVDGIPEFHYAVDGVEVRERITAAKEGVGFVRDLRVGPTAAPVFIRRDAGAGVRVAASVGRWEGDELRLDGSGTRSVVLTVTREQP